MYFKSELNIFANLDYLVGFLAGLLVLLMMPSMLMTVQASDANVTENQAEAAITSTSEDHHRPFSFPRWPQSRRVYMERIPLAPPGPYMSSALSEFTFRDSSFDRDWDGYASRNDSPDVPMEKFSPDIPWPSQAKSPARWRPDNGYRFIEPPVEKKPYQTMPSNSSSNNNGYKRRPVMGWPERGSVHRSTVTQEPVY